MPSTSRAAIALSLIAFLAGSCAAGERVPRGRYEAFQVHTSNLPRATISAWLLPAARPNGTLFMCHGFRDRKDNLVWYEWIREEMGWNMVFLDFRGHGESPQPGGEVCTLGYHEQWDLKAVIDWAEQRGLAKPYVCMGMSMGAAIALRWAGQDERIDGVLAFSPFRTAWDAMHQFHYRGVPMGSLPSLLIHGGFKRMMQEVDILAAVSRRDDLRLWIAVGDQDWFPVDDQRAILAASRSPELLKRLVIIPESGHAQGWKWSGNDPLIKEFLLASRNRRDDSTEVVGTSAVVGLLVAVIIARARDARVCVSLARYAGRGRG